MINNPINNPLISVIVPSYNVEKIYNECVDSILGQTYSNLQVILVDDGSTDGTGRIADEYANMDSRVTVIHAKNGGASSARNKGLEIAKGDYIGFVDSDDWIEKDMFANLLAPFLSGELDEKSFTIVSYRNHNMDGTVTDFAHVENKQLIAEDTLWDNFFDINGDGLILQAIWNKLFPAALIKGLKFREGIIGEDIELLYHIIDRAKSCMVLPHLGYNARQISTSVTHKPLSAVNFAIADLTDEKLEFISRKHPDKLKAAHAYNLKQQTNMWQRLVYADNARDFADKKPVLKARIKRDLEATKGTGLVNKTDRLIGELILIGLFKPVRKIMMILKGKS